MRKRQILASAAMALFFVLAVAVAQHEKPKEDPHPVSPDSGETRSGPAAPAEHKQSEKQKEAKPAEATGAKQAGENTAEGELTEASREAAGEENAEFKHSPSVQWLARITGLSLKSAYWLAMGFNFAIIAAAIVWFSRSSLPQMFRNRTKNIQKTMEEARRSSEDASKRLAEIESRLAKLDGEIGSMRATAENEAAEEEKRIRLAAEEDRRKIVEATAAEIQAAARLAERELRAYAAELAVSLAEKRIQIDPTTDRALVESFVQQLGTQRDGKEGK